MDRDTLVKDRDLPAGRRLVDALAEAGLPLVGAGWMYFEEAKEWQFYVVSPAVSKLGPFVVYDQVRAVLDHLGPDFPIEFIDVGLAGIEDNLPLRVVTAATGDETVQRVRGVGFVERTVPDAYVYRVDDIRSVPAAA